MFSNYIIYFDISYLSIQSGPKELTEESLGVNYRALGDLFLLSEQRKETMSYHISVQMLEIYNEQVRDLLVTDGLNKRYPTCHLFFYIIIICGWNASYFFMCS